MATTLPPSKSSIVFKPIISTSKSSQRPVDKPTSEYNKSVEKKFKSKDDGSAMSIKMVMSESSTITSCAGNEPNGNTKRMKRFMSNGDSQDEYNTDLSDTMPTNNNDIDTGELKLKKTKRKIVDFNNENQIKLTEQQIKMNLIRNQLTSDRASRQAYLKQGWCLALKWCFWQSFWHIPSHVKVAAYVDLE
jgi:hypothetical protein